MRLLITRPAEDAQELADRLAALGHEAMIEPMLTIQALDFTLPERPITAILLTSRHAAGMIAGTIGGELRKQLPVYCVGAATADAARTAGFSNVIKSGGDAASLIIDAAAALDPEAGIVLHARGRHARGNIVGNLRCQGFEAREVVAYEARAARQLSDTTANAIRTRSLDGVLLFSPRTAEIFARLVSDAGLAPALTGVTAFCLSDAVAAGLGNLAMKLSVAGAPRISALIGLIADAKAVKS